MHFKYVVYKITFPNGKIYIGKDVGEPGHSIRYFGSWDNNLIENDFTKSELSNFSLKKEILYESHSKEEVEGKEVEFILQYKSNNLNIGYNKSPKFDPE